MSPPHGPTASRCGYRGWRPRTTARIRVYFTMNRPDEPMDERIPDSIYERLYADLRVVERVRYVRSDTGQVLVDMTFHPAETVNGASKTSFRALPPSASGMDIEVMPAEFRDDDQD